MGLLRFNDFVFVGIHILRIIIFRSQWFDISSFGIFLAFPIDLGYLLRRSHIYFIGAYLVETLR